MGSVDVILFVRIFLYVANDLNDANAYIYVVPMQSNYMPGLNKEQCNKH